MPSISFRLPYCADLTANHYLGRRRDGRVYVKKHVALWTMALINEIRYRLDGSMLGPPLTIRIDWQGPQQPDEDGRCKVIWDAVQQATGINDACFIPEPGSYQRRPAREAEITVTIRWE